MYNNSFHNSFKLNGKSFISKKELLTFSEKFSPGIFSFLTDWFDDKSFVKVQTSGSTGKPKAIALKKEYMINSAKKTGAFFDLPQNTLALLCLSMDYIAGKMMLVRALTLGWHLEAVKAVSNPLVDNDKNYDFCAMVPLQMQNSLSELYKVKKLIVGGGAVDKNLLLKIQSQTTAIFATYGMTETITHIAVKKLNGFNTTELGSSNHFKVLPNIKIATDDRGCLIIDAPSIIDNQITTNDLVGIISDTEFKWLGRIDNVVNSGGVKLIPEQIEEKLSSVMEQRFFVAGIPDLLLGEKLILIIESNKKIENLKTKILNLLMLKKFEIPREIYTIGEFVETDTKKINRIATLKSVKINYTI